jgi:ABC-type Zn uptake system ZnuABC Zn-binding protein ZnuA
VVAAVALSGVGCAASDDPTADGAPTGAGAPRVVATTSILGDIVANVAGGSLDVEVLMPREADPHTFEASARQAALLRDADLVVSNGLGLEEGLSDLLAAAEDDGVEVLAVGERLDPMRVGADDGGGHEHESEGAHGDEDAPDDGDGTHDDEDAHDDGDGTHDDEDAHDGGLDPHVWMDPVRMMTAVDLIADALDEAGVEGVAGSAADYRAEIGELSDSIVDRIATVPPDERVLVTNHDTLGYYADRFGLEVVATVVPGATTSGETSASGFAELIALIEDRDVAAVFASTAEDTRLAETISDRVGREVAVVALFAGSLGPDGSGAEDYLGLLDVTTDLLVGSLR